MSVVFALERLFDDVVASFTADSIPCDQVFGWREPARKKTTATRITWTPGDPTGAVGDIASAKFPGRDPRPVATLMETFTCRIMANDPAAPETERAQYHIVRMLFDDWFAACKRSSTTRFQLVRAEWNTATNERRHGAELVAICTIESAIVDESYSYDEVTSDDGTAAAVTIAATPSLDLAGTADPVEYVPTEYVPPEEPTP